jgi:vacuolar protein sorting-associated protein 11
MHTLILLVSLSMQARPDGLYSYSHTERTGVAPIDGTKLAMCVIPPPIPAEKVREVDWDHVGSGYALVASTDTNSGRDVVDIYDATNKLVAFHLLLSPGHRASNAAGVSTLPARLPDGSIRGGRSSAVVLTTGGALVTFTEKLTDEKISLLVQKHLYSAAIVVAYADPSYEASDIIALYQNYAEHLYRKGDFSGAMDQYIHTIGSLESSHVIFRYLDAPKIPLLVRYLEKLRAKDRATPVHNELLRTCYLKLNDVSAAEAIAISTSWSVTDASLESILSNLSAKPKDALATICSLDAHQAAEVLAIHGASLARVLPRETAGVVISLCVGSYAPKLLAEASMAETLGEAAATTTAAAIDLNKMVNTNENPKAMVIEPYPVALFASAFVEHPKLLRLILAHCNRNKCPLTPSLRRALLELTLAEWNQAKRCGDTEVEKLRHKEAIAVSI